MIEGFKHSIVNKLDNIKNIEKESNSSNYSKNGYPDLQDSRFDISKMEEKQEETVKKIDEMLNAKAEIINANAESIKAIENRLSKMDISVSTVKRSIDEYNERFTKMEENILELLSLYEIVY
jgi:predicted nuclease with TOPRIM domain